jgi:alkylhydroperoxidase family enzyme
MPRIRVLTLSLLFFSMASGVWADCRVLLLQMGQTLDQGEAVVTEVAVELGSYWKRQHRCDEPLTNQGKAITSAFTGFHFVAFEVLQLIGAKIAESGSTELIDSVDLRSLAGLKPILEKRVFAESPTPSLTDPQWEEFLQYAVSVAVKHLNESLSESLATKLASIYSVGWRTSNAKTLVCSKVAETVLKYATIGRVFGEKQLQAYAQELSSALAGVPLPEDLDLKTMLTTAASQYALSLYEPRLQRARTERKPLINSSTGRVLEWNDVQNLVAREQPALPLFWSIVEDPKTELGKQIMARDAQLRPFDQRLAARQAELERIKGKEAWEIEGLSETTGEIRIKLDNLIWSGPADQRATFDKLKSWLVRVIVNSERLVFEFPAIGRSLPRIVFPEKVLEDLLLYAPLKKGSLKEWADIRLVGVDPLNPEPGDTLTRPDVTNFEANIRVLTTFVSPPK